MDAIPEISADQLIQALRDHAAWLDGAGGARLRMEAKLPLKFNFRRARLQQAVFSGSDLNRADLAKANVARDRPVVDREYDPLERRKRVPAPGGLVPAARVGRRLVSQA